MEKIRVALVQTSWSGSRQSMITSYQQLVREASAHGAGIVCLPEFTLSPYFPGTTDQAGFDWAEARVGGPSDTVFSDLAREHGVVIISSIFERTDDGHFFDTAIIHNRYGQQIGWTRKVHIPSGEGYHETDFFAGAGDYPVHDLDAVKLSAPTCYDQWFPETARICALNGAEFIYFPTAIGSEPTDPGFDSQNAWQTVMRGHAIANGIFIAAANRTGVENDVTFYGSSFICDPTGQTGRDTTEVIHADLDPQTLMHWRELFPLLHQRKPASYGRITEAVGTPAPPRWQSHHAFTDQTAGG